MGDRLRAQFAGWVQKRFYYGWVIVGAVVVSNLAAFANNATFGLYVTPLEQEFGWSRSLIALAPTLATTFGAVLAPGMGYLVDRLGVRALMIGGSLVAAASFVLLGQTASLWQLYVGYALAWSVLFAGVGQLVSNVAVTRWFVRRRGRAMGIVMMGASGSGLLFINLQTYLIDTINWRVAWTAQGGLILVLVIVPAVLFIIESPEKVGIDIQKVEGLRTGANGVSGGAAEEVSWTLGEAVRVRAFWTALASGMLGSLVVSGYFAHAVPHMENLGFSRPLAGAAWSGFFLVGIIAKFAWGFITEKITVRWSMVSLYLGEGLGIYLLMTAKEPRDLFVFALVGGFWHGPFLQLGNQVWGDYFGRKSIGRVYGAAQPGIVFFNAIGPIVGGMVYDLTGNYRRFLQFLIAICAVASFLFMVEPKPVKKVPATSGGGVPAKN